MQDKRTIEEICKSLLSQPDQYYYHKTFQRHLDDIERFKDDPDFRFNEKIAKAYIFLIENMKHYKDEFSGQYLRLEDWQKAVIGILQGWETYNSQRGKWARRFQKSTIFMARKNGKTLLAAAVALGDIYIRQTQHGQVVCAANKRDQARLAFEDIGKLWNTVPDLRKTLKERRTEFVETTTGSRVFTLGRDSKTEDGLNISTCILDEYHAAPTDAIYDVVKTSMGARLNPHIMVISTAGFDLASPLIEEINEATKILDGDKIDDISFAFLCQIDDDMDPLSLEAVKATNPNYGVSVYEDFILNALEEAKTRPDKKNNFLTKHVNVFVNSAEDFISRRDWVSTAVDKIKVDPKRTKALLIGTDLSTSLDWTAISLTYFRDDNTIDTKVKLWCPAPDIIAVERDLGIPLQTWKDKGHVEVVDSLTTDYKQIFDFISEHALWAKKNKIPVKHLYDPYKAHGLVQKIESEISNVENIKVNQGPGNLNEPLNTLQRMILEGNFRHEKNPALNWMVGNVEIKYDVNGNKKPDRSKKKKKIDGFAAIVNSIKGVYSFWGKKKKTGVFFI